MFNNIFFFESLGFCNIMWKKYRRAEQAAVDNMAHAHGMLGYAVAHLVEVLRYKPEGRVFDFRCCHWNFSLT